jgi:polyhydroxybutyrate depolymerase
MTRNILLFIFMSMSVAITAQTTLTGAIQSGGLTRDYRLYKPALYNGTVAVPLVINFHGYSSNNFEQEFYGSFKAIADTANFLVVLPNGTLDNQGNRYWNTFNGSASVDDVAFIANLIDTLQATYNIDPQRIYATGMSNGGFMSYALACELNDRITAIASVTGSMTETNLAACNPTRPVPVMEIHGTADDVVPYTGGTLLFFSPIPDVVDKWVAVNHCNPVPAVSPVPNTSTTDGCTAEHSVYTGGDNGSTVEHYKIIGGGHTWPGAAFNIGVTNQDFNASYEIWRFFLKYHLDGLTSTPTLSDNSSHWTAYPNPAGDYTILQSDHQQSVERIRVFNIAGQLVETINAIPANAAIRINTGNWHAGVYLVEVEQEGKVVLLKVVKE